MSLPLRPLGPAAVYNGLILLQVGLAALAAYAAAVWVGASRSASVLASAVVGASPFLLGLLHSGLSEYVGLALPVLYVAALLRGLGLLDAGPTSLRGALLTGALLGLCALQAPYYAVFGGLLLLCCLPGPGWRARLRPAAVTAAVGLVVAAPWLALVWQGLHATASLVQPGTAPGWVTPSLPPVDLAGFLVPGDRHFPDLATQGNPGIMHVHYLGWIAMGLAAWGLWRRPETRRLLLPVGLYGLLCLGPEARVADHFVGTEAFTLPLPLRLAYLEGSPLAWIHHPYRMVALLVPLLALLAALALRSLPRWAAGVAVALGLVEALARSPAPWPVPTTPTASPPPLTEGVGAVLDWPPDATDWNRRYLRWQLDHGRPIAYGVNVFLPEPLRQDPLIADLLHLLDDPAGRARNRDIPLSGPLHLGPPPGPSGLAAMGFEVLLLHHSAFEPGELERSTARIQRELGEPSQRGQDWTAWVVR